MLQVESSPTLADLSRNASVISSSSDSESIQDVPRTPRPRPTRTFSSPRSRSPQLPAIQPIRPPSYLTRELGVSDRDSAPYPARSRPHPRSQSRKRSRSRNPSANNRLSSQDFTFLSTLGEGSYSSVMRARHIRTGQDYAIKILDKNHLARKDKMAVAMTEKLVLIKLGAGHPGIIHLHWTFQDDWSLFFVLDLAPNGEMQTRISRMGSLSLACARHYTAQIIDALDYMHAKDVIHRDLKPENLLLDGDYRIKITDFGTGKILEPGQERANSWVGTAQYISPELLEHGETSKRSDLWSLGCVVYQMIAGRFAFHGPSEYLTWQKIKKLDYTFPEGFDEDAKDFVQRLFVLDPTQRLGAGPEGSPNSRAALRAHPFLASTKWETLWTDPSPPLEAGLVQKEGWKNALGNAGTINGLDEDEDEWEGKWGDVGAIWDSLVGGEDNDGEVRGSGWNGGGGGSRINGTDASTRLDTGRGGSRYIGRGRASLADDTDNDGLCWAEDAEGPEFERFRTRGTNVLMRCEEGDEEAEHAHTEEQTSVGIEDTLVVIADDSNNSTGEINSTPKTLPIPIPISIPTTTLDPPSSLSSSAWGLGLAPGSDSGSGSGTTSDGSLAELKGVQQGENLKSQTTQAAVDGHLVLQAARLSLGEHVVGESEAADGGGSRGEERGRDRTLTPVQGNVLYAKNVGWSSILLPGEHVLFHSRVEARSPKRRGSRLLLPLSVVSPTRPKSRELVLTNYRLLCVKRRDGGSGGAFSSGTGNIPKTSGSKNRNGKDGAMLGVSFTVKTELGLGARAEVRGKDQKDGKERDKDSKEREKETKSIVQSAERKSDREFVVLTSMTSQTYAAETSALTTQWIDKINASLVLPRQYSPSKR